MEPMTLGSPGGSPACGNSSYLPSFLMGDNSLTSPRSTLSPNKRGNLNFSVTSPQGATSPQDFNRSALTQKTLFLQQQNLQKNQSFNNSGFQNHNTSIPAAGPPTQGLFDSLRNDNIGIDNNCGPGLNRSVAFKENLGGGTPMGLGTAALHQRTMNESYLTAGGSSFDTSHIQQQMTSPIRQRDFCNFNNESICSPTMSNNPNLWVTVFGFPHTATPLILSHFSQYGTILDKVFAPQNGNWIHLKYSTVLECDKALNFHEKILGNNIMIAVTSCRDKTILHKRALSENNL
ncbi:NUP35 family protein [Megaselia abdita]